MGRGADHLHRIVLCRNADERERVARWVELYREFGERYGFGFVDDPLRPRHPKTAAGRPDRSRPKRDMVFEQAAIAGHYLGSYLGGGQLERAEAAEDRSWRVWWVSPTLLRMSGWSMQRCKWVRQGWVIQQGVWGRYWNQYLREWMVARLPAWYSRPEDRAWVLAVLGVT